MSKNKSDRETLIEQCLQDAHCERTGEMLDESWWDDMKANVAGTVQGAKQGLKNFKKKAKNTIQRGKNAVARSAGYVSNVSKGIGNAAVGLHKAGMNQPAAAPRFQTKKLRSMDQGVDKSESIPAGFAKNYAKLVSYSKGISENIEKVMQAAAAAFPTIPIEQLPVATDLENAKAFFSELAQWDMEADYEKSKEFFNQLANK